MTDILPKRIYNMTDILPKRVDEALLGGGEWFCHTHVPSSLSHVANALHRVTSNLVRGHQPAKTLKYTEAHSAHVHILPSIDTLFKVGYNRFFKYISPQGNIVQKCTHFQHRKWMYIQCIMHNNVTHAYMEKHEKTNLRWAQQKTLRNSVDEGHIIF